jgi:hypothetical protein
LCGQHDIDDSAHVSEVQIRNRSVRPRKDHRGVDLISDALPSAGWWL